MEREADLDIRRKRVLFDFLSRRGAGEAVSIESFEHANPDLMPELRAMLEGGLSKLRQTFASDLPTPSLVRGYAFVREISGGGQGTVYEALQESTRQTVAIKIIRPTNRNAIARFEREVAALAGLNHPGIVRIVDCGRTSDGNYFLAMEYVSGNDLDQWLAQHRERGGPQQELTDCFIEIAQAMGAAHAAGIVHRDLKPSNIRIDPSGRPRVIDFGLASLTHDLSARDLTITGNVLGSIKWASPEQACGDSKSVTPASDVYSLGVLLYEAIAGKPPYEVDGPLHTVTRSICTARPARLDQRTDGNCERVSGVLADVVHRCIAKQPEARYRSGVLLAEALQAVSSTVPQRRWPRRRFVAGILAMSLLSSLVFSGWLIARQPFSPSPINVAGNVPTMTNSIGMRFRKIPSRPFLIGSPPNEAGRSSEEVERTASVAENFWMAETEVTREQYRLMMRPDQAQLKAAETSFPANNLSWTDANLFCEKLSARENRKYRLPSEEEWEICCRAGTRTPFAITRPASSIWFDTNSHGTLHIVAAMPSNDWGFFDMAGNVAEWTESLDRQSLLHDASDISQIEFRVVRGGSASSPLNNCRSSARSFRDVRFGAEDIGFRPALIDP